jgi:hypothetical protein
MDLNKRQRYDAHRTPPYAVMFSSIFATRACCRRGSPQRLVAVAQPLTAFINCGRPLPIGFARYIAAGDGIAASACCSAMISDDLP